MKNKMMGFIIALFATLAFTSAKAQCGGLQIHNTLTCPANVTINVYSSCPGAPCNSYVTTVGAGAIVPIACGPCLSVCNVQVTVNTIGGGAPTPVPVVDFVTTNVPFTTTAACGGSRTFTYYGSAKTFKLY